MTWNLHRIAIEILTLDIILIDTTNDNEYDDQKVTPVKIKNSNNADIIIMI